MNRVSEALTAFNYALILPNLRGASRAIPQHSVLAPHSDEDLMRIKGRGRRQMSPGELQGKYAVALKRIGGERRSDDAGRHKPIYERNSKQAEHQAITEAANALTAL